MSDIKCLEHHTLKVPYEILNKRFRSSQKVLDREAFHVQTTAGELEKVINLMTFDDIKKGQTANITALLDQLEERLLQMQEKCNESVQEELDSVGSCKRRVDHLMVGVSNGSEGTSSAAGGENKSAVQLSSKTGSCLCM